MTVHHCRLQRASLRRVRPRVACLEGSAARASAMSPRCPPLCLGCVVTCLLVAVKAARQTRNSCSSLRALSRARCRRAEPPPSLLLAISCPACWRSAVRLAAADGGPSRVLQVSLLLGMSRRSANDMRASAAAARPSRSGRASVGESLAARAEYVVRADAGFRNSSCSQERCSLTSTHDARASVVLRSHARCAAHASGPVSNEDPKVRARRPLALGIRSPVSAIPEVVSLLPTRASAPSEPMLFHQRDRVVSVASALLCRAAASDRAP